MEVYVPQGQPVVHGYTYVLANDVHQIYIGVYIYEYISHETTTGWNGEDVDRNTVGGVGKGAL